MKGTTYALIICVPLTILAAALMPEVTLCLFGLAAVALAFAFALDKRVKR